ncbi:MAG: hypothetical protein AB7O57_08120, partial [Hyphomicrobiaceae bacterium]
MFSTTPAQRLRHRHLFRLPQCGRHRATFTGFHPIADIVSRANRSHSLLSDRGTVTGVRAEEGKMARYDVQSNVLIEAAA